MRFLALLAAIGVALAAMNDAQESLPRVLIQTDLGEIEIEVDPKRAPLTAANFLKYVDAGLFDGGRFHRTVRPDNQREKAVPIDVIQGAANRERSAEFPPAIPLERTTVTGLSHKDGTVSMARTTPDTGRSEFFICIGDQPELDFAGRRNPDGQGFAAFGRVIRGMDVVRRIQRSAAEGETLTPPVRIGTARRTGPGLPQSAPPERTRQSANGHRRSIDNGQSANRPYCRHV